MKTRAILGGLALAWLTAAKPLAQGIPFEQGNYQAALAKAQQTGKLLFVDAYAKWCGPCKWMAANGFQDAEVGNFFKEHFISYQYDMEAGGGPLFAQIYSVESYPTLFLLKGDGSVVAQQSGALDAAGLLKFARAAVGKVSPPAAANTRPVPAGDPAPVPLPVPGPANVTGPRPAPAAVEEIPQWSKQEWEKRLESAISVKDEDEFMKLGEQLVQTRLPDRDWMFVLAQEQWLKAGGDSAVFVENLFFWAETSGTEDPKALNLAADLILDNVDDPSLWGFAELWKTEAREMLK